MAISQEDRTSPEVNVKTQGGLNTLENKPDWGHVRANFVKQYVQTVHLNFPCPRESAIVASLNLTFVIWPIRFMDFSTSGIDSEPRGS